MSALPFQVLSIVSGDTIQVKACIYIPAAHINNENQQRGIYRMLLTGPFLFRIRRWRTPGADYMLPRSASSAGKICDLLPVRRKPATPCSVRDQRSPRPGPARDIPRRFAGEITEPMSERRSDSTSALRYFQSGTPFLDMTSRYQNALSLGVRCCVS